MYIAIHVYGKILFTLFDSLLAKNYVIRKI